MHTIFVAPGQSNISHHAISSANRQAASKRHIASDLLFKEPCISRTYLLLKRILDICVSLPGLLVLVLCLLLIVPCMLWEDRGPIFYRQLRIGRHGKPFWIYKIRSMIVDADAYLTYHPALFAAWQQGGKLQHDPRVTRVGRFLRRTSLDELPQLLNVLWGEMSLVGPRAIQVSEGISLAELHDLRLLVKPGLTGLWQISGRSTTTYMQRALLDCTFVLECSLLVDLFILSQTLPVVIRGSGAY